MKNILPTIMVMALALGIGAILSHHQAGAQVAPMAGPYFGDSSIKWFETEFIMVERTPKYHMTSTPNGQIITNSITTNEVGIVYRIGIRPDGIMVATKK